MELGQEYVRTGRERRVSVAHNVAKKQFNRVTNATDTRLLMQGLGH